jgi:DNA-binding LacI/PurR family transcriptional regulator
LVADFFLDAKHTRLAYLAGQKNTTTNLMREKGFTDRLRERGYGEIIREQAAYSYQAGREAARRLLTRDDPPEAVFCAADIIALGVMDTARFELGIQIPDDLSVVGFDDISAAAWPAYNLTTVRQPIDAMIEATLELLERDDGGSSRGEVELLPVELIVRGSAKV